MREEAAGAAEIAASVPPLIFNKRPSRLPVSTSKPRLSEAPILLSSVPTRKSSLPNLAMRKQRSNSNFSDSSQKSGRRNITPFAPPAPPSLREPLRVSSHNNLRVSDIL